MTIYNGSKEHLDNCARALAAANSIRVECIHCHQLKPKSSIVSHENACIENIATFKYCPQCGIRVLKRENKFCSSSCGTTYNNSMRDKGRGAKISESLKSGYKSGRIKSTFRPENKKSCRVHFKLCSECDTYFLQKGWSEKSSAKTCSQECRDDARMKRANPFRCLSIPFEHEGKTIYLQSHWEEKVAIYLNEKGIEWSRPKPISWYDDAGKKRRYFPDFYLPKFDVYLDPKNLHVQKADERKMIIVSQQIDVVVGVLEEIIWFIDELGGEREDVPAPIITPIEVVDRPAYN